MSAVKIDFDELAKELGILNNDDGKVLNGKEKLKCLALLTRGLGEILEEAGKKMFEDVELESDDRLSLEENISYCLSNFTRFNRELLKLLK